MKQMCKKSNISVDCFEIHRIADALERIAVALENHKKPVSEIHERQESTPFPWHEVSARTRQNIQKEVSESNSRGCFAGRNWPLTCEDLVAVGVVGILEIRNMGEKSLREIELKLLEKGFSNFF